MWGYFHQSDRSHQVLPVKCTLNRLRRVSDGSLVTRSSLKSFEVHWCNQVILIAGPTAAHNSETEILRDPIHQAQEPRRPKVPIGTKNVRFTRAQKKWKTRIADWVICSHLRRYFRNIAKQPRHTNTQNQTPVSSATSGFETQMWVRDQIVNQTQIFWGWRVGRPQKQSKPK